MKIFDPRSQEAGCITRYSSRHQPLRHSFLQKEILEARRYDRIAGYFSSSIFELAGEELENLEKVRIVCNADIQQKDWAIAHNRETLLLGSLNNDPQADSRRNRVRYQHLARFLDKHPDAIRVVPDEICGFVHGKAGLIERKDGSRLAFMGSMNETRQGWDKNYEILWSDSSAKGCDWTQDEFNFLWDNGKPLPEAVINEIKRRASRTTVEDLNELDEDEVGPSAFVESPLYCQGSDLRPWQIRFVDIAKKHYKTFGCARLLLADEVGLGKTFSITAAVVTLALLRQREASDATEPLEDPIFIFVPATLTRQWQNELHDHLGIPAARWDVRGKLWLGPNDLVLTDRGAEEIANCPARIGIVSTSIFTHNTKEAEVVKDLPAIETLVLDESHKARVGSDGDANRLMQAMRELAQRSINVILSTATPMQLSEDDLWDQLSILCQGKGSFIFCNGTSDWGNPNRVKDIMRSGTIPDYGQAWRLISSYVPPPEFIEVPKTEAHRKMAHAFRMVLGDLSRRMPDLGCRGEYPWAVSPTNNLNMKLEQDPHIRLAIERLMWTEVGKTSFFQAYNPIVMHTVLRKRKDLERHGLLKRIDVHMHPDFDDHHLQCNPILASYFERQGKRSYGIRGYDCFDVVYGYAKEFAREHSRGNRGGSFLGHILMKRLCSSPHAGLATARKILEGREDELLSEETDDIAQIKKVPLSDRSRDFLNEIVGVLDRSIQSNQYEDRKLSIITQYLVHLRWAEDGCILFSQYYDTAEWVARYLTEVEKVDMTIGLYAGGAKSRLYYADGYCEPVSQNKLKAMVQEGRVDVLVATDAACEGLNLQQMQSIINIDLPWNPVKLQQRIGRIKRVGQKANKINVLNLVYQDTIDEAVYTRLSQRFQNQFYFLGSLPDFFEDDWIEEEKKSLEELEQRIDQMEAVNSFDLHYGLHVETETADWRSYKKVFPRHKLHRLLLRADKISPSAWMAAY